MQRKVAPPGGRIGQKKKKDVATNMTLRLLRRDELETVWTIDRREVHHNIYRYDAGRIVLTPFYFDVPGWGPGQVEEGTPRLYACFDAGGAIWGAFDGETLVGVAVLNGEPIASDANAHELKYLYVSRDFRGLGVGTRLFDAVCASVRTLGAAELYISATPTENTVNFYRCRGCVVAETPDPELFAAEPNDIPLRCIL